MGLRHRALVFFVALAGLVDGGLIVGGALAYRSIPGWHFGYLLASVLLLAAALGAAFGATIAANAVVRTSRGRYLPVLAVTAIAGVTLAVAQIWLVENWLHESFMTWLLLASLILIPLVATAGATEFRTALPAPGRRPSAVAVGAIVVFPLIAILLLFVVSLGGAFLSTSS